MQQSSLSNQEKQQQLNEELIQAIKDKKDLSIIEEIIKKGADVNCAGKDGLTALYVACQNGHSETVKILIEKGADVKQGDNDGSTPLHFACENGHSETAKILIDNGADFKQGDNDGWTPLHLACRNGHSEIAKILIEKGADVNCVVTKGYFAGKTPIQITVEKNKIEVINLLFELGADVSCLNQEFIEKYNEEITQETKDLIAKITQAENIQKRNEDLERKKNASAELQQEKGDLVSAQINQQQQDDRQRIEQQFQTQQEERKKYQDQISKLLQETKEIQTNQDKLKKLGEIADIAPNLEITIGNGSQAKTMKLGDIMDNLEQNLGAILSQIQLQFETQGQRLDQIEEARPSSRIREVESSCCLPPEKRTKT